MKISYTEKISEIDHPVIIVSDKAKKIVPSLSIFDKEMINIVQEFLQEIYLTFDRISNIMPREICVPTHLNA